jgi:hypothetical protein
MKPFVLSQKYTALEAKGGEKRHSMRDRQIVQLTHPMQAVDKQGKTVGQPVCLFATSTCSMLNVSSVALAGPGRSPLYEPSYHFRSALTLQEIVQLSTAFGNACLRLLRWYT